MERFVITIRPPSLGDEGLLRVDDAMQQVIDALKLFQAAERTLGAENQFEWRLERATTSSPFTVVARAEATHPGVDVSQFVRDVNSTVASGMRNFVEYGEMPGWLDPEGLQAVRNLLLRTTNGIGETDIYFGDHEQISIDRNTAESGMRVLEASAHPDD